MRFLVFFLAVIVLAQEATRKTTFGELDALALSNDKLELTVITKGGAFAHLVLKDDPEHLSPLWDPARYARETNRKFHGYSMGHFVCVDGFGPVSAEEKEAGLSGHGEAHTLPWETTFSRKEGATSTVTEQVKLPLAQETYTRTLRLVDGENIVYVQSELENQMGLDRPINWAEHATIGSPFLEPGLTVVDMPAKYAKTRAHEKQNGMPNRLASFKDFTWPMAPTVNGKKIDLRPVPAKPNSLDHTTCLMDPARKVVWVTALHTGKHLLFGYVFRHEDYPWLQTWEFYSPDLRMARGLEFGTQPFDVPRREAISLGTMFNAPTYRWLPAKSKIESRYLFFYGRVPEGFRKVDDVRLEGGQLIIEDKKAKKQVTWKASLPL